MIADRVSLSPNLISYSMNIMIMWLYMNLRPSRLTLTDTVSFSFTIGITPIDMSSLNVFTAFK